MDSVFPAESVVRWNGTDRATSFVGSIKLTATITPADIQNPGVAQVTVFSPLPGGGTSDPVNFTIQGPNPNPVINSLMPTGALVGGPSFALTISGSNFVPGAIVKFSGADRIPTSTTPTQIVVTILAEDIDTAGPQTVQVFNPVPGGGPSNTLNFLVGTPISAPTLATITPMQLPAGSAGFTLVATGTGFIPGATVLRWNASNRTTTVINESTLNATIPASDLVTPGPAAVTIFNPSGGTSALMFTIINPTPVITSLNPTIAPTNSPAVTMVVTGTGFVSNSIVRWNGANRADTVCQFNATLGDNSSVGPYCRDDGQRYRVKCHSWWRNTRTHCRLTSRLRVETRYSILSTQTLQLRAASRRSY